MPDVSVVIASVNGLPEIDECLSALERQQGGVDYEIIVANRCQNGTAEHIRRRFPRVRLLDFPEQLTIPELRATAMAQAKADIIVVTEDHCMAPENWLLEIMKAHKLGYMVVGGEVKNIPGNNAAYKRAALDLIDDGMKRNFWESFLHDELRKKGVKLVLVPSIVIKHKKEFGFFYFLSQRFHYSRSFAGMRRALLPPARRLYYLLASPALPFLMALRVTRHVLLEKKRFYKEFIFSLPFLSVFFIGYAMGEFVGYLLGPGQSLKKVE